MTHQYTHLVLSGGGMSGMVYLGALRYLQQEGYDKHIRHIAGASIGALFAAAFAFGISMGDLENRFKEFYNNKEKCSIPLSMEMIIFSIDTLGIDDGRRLIDPIKDLLGHMTFLEFSKKTGKNLIISATHMETMNPTYFSVDITPHVLVADAVRASMAVPMLVKPVGIGEDFYIDGGVTDGVPINAFMNVPHETILILHLTRASIKVKSIGVKLSPVKFITSMLQTYLRNYLGIRLLETMYPHYCQFTICPISFAPLVWEDDRFIMQISDEKIDASFAAGYTRIQEFFETRKVITLPD
jgi:predicted acylesterase/phospholipase RssA